MSTEGTLPVALVGLGAIGRDVAAAVLDTPELRLVAAMDVDPQLVGKPLSQLLDRPAGDLRVEEESPQALARAGGGALLQLTGSRLPTVVAQLERALDAGLNVISSCEELAFPWLNHPELAERLEKRAVKAEVSVLGAGVNPGFVLDRLVCTLGSIAGKVTRIEAERVVDASTRREQLQRKVGAGLTREQFDRAVGAGKIGHVGLVESAALVSAGLGLGCDEFDESIEPFMATRSVAGPVPVDIGRVAGASQVARGFASGREVVTLSVTIAVGAPDPHDEIRITADPPLHFRSQGGVPGDRATIWSIVNAIPAVVTAEPGLLTVLDLPAGR
ncbi:MAG TPA: dihydrodipicolinate reductase [Myxococcales bacterium]|nr:dihydrodipicolinate reductase [Myxococcales bacterium]